MLKMKRPYTIPVGMVICMVAVYLISMFNRDETELFTPARSANFVKSEKSAPLIEEKLDPVWRNLFSGEKRFPVVRKPAEKPAGIVFTGVYLNFDTSKYTDMAGRIFIPSETVLKNMTFDEIEELYFRYIEIIQITCPRTRHIGNDVDGGYHVCETLLPNECLAYSFGSRREFSFDDGLAAHYSCEVHVFDPYDKQTDYQQAELVTFHEMGIGFKDEVNSRNKTIKTFNSIRIMLGHAERPLDLVKIDTEGAEWASLTQILESNVLDKAHVKLLIIEFHMLSTTRDFAANMSCLRLLKGIYDAGFRIYYTHIWTTSCMVTDPKTNKKRAYCHEVHFLRV